MVLMTLVLLVDYRELLFWLDFFELSAIALVEGQRGAKPSSGRKPHIC